MASFDHVHLFCTDLTRMVDLWTRGLGAEFVRFRKFGDADGAIISMGGVHIFLKQIPSGSPEHHAAATGPNHLGIRVDNVNATIADLEANFGAKLINQVSDECAFIYLPDGLMFELMGKYLVV